MMINVRVTANARKPSEARSGETSFEVKVDENLWTDKPNKRLVETLSDHFNVPRTSITIVKL